MTGAYGRKRRPGGRLQLLDVIRGITLLSMIAYHGSWDLVYLAGVDWPWYHSLSLAAVDLLDLYSSVRLLYDALFS